MRSRTHLFFLISLFVMHNSHAEFVVNDVAISGNDAKAYFIIRSNEAQNLDTLVQGKLIKITLPEDVSWKAPLTQEPYQGLIESYRIEGGDVMLTLAAPAHVSSIIYRRQNNQVESILVVQPGASETPPQVSDLIRQDTRQKQQQPAVSNKPRRLIPQTVKRVDLDFNDDVIRIAITLAQPQRLKVIENDHTHQFFIRLPKVKWEEVALDHEFEEIVSNYFVDQSHPKWTTLVFGLDRNLTILKREIISKPGHDPLFVLYLGQETGMRPVWGETQEFHMGADLKKAEQEESLLDRHMHYQNSETHVIQKNPFSFQTEKPLYVNKVARFKAGTTNYTDISRGAYMGLTAGYSAGQTSMSMHSPNVKFAYQPAMTGINYGFFVGYGRNFNQLYAGAEVFFDMNRQSGRIKGQDAGLGEFLTRSFNKHSYGAALRLGMYAGPESMLYIRLGALGTKFRFKSRGNLAGQLSVDTTTNRGMTGFLYGFGMEMALDNHFSVRMEYDRIVYQAFNRDFANGLGAVQSKFGPRMDRYTLALSYKFNDSIGPNSPTGIFLNPTGFYMGTGLDMSNASVNRSLSSPNINWGMKSTTLTPMWMMHMGYGVQYGRYYYGMELSSTLGTKFIKENLTDALLGSTQDSVIRLQPTVGLYLRGGYTFGHGNMAYLKSGLLLSSFQRISNTQGVARLVGTKTVKKQLVGLAVGGGLETFVSENISIRNEVMHEMYRKFKVSEPGNISERYNPTLTRYQLTMNYIF